MHKTEASLQGASLFFQQHKLTNVEFYDGKYTTNAFTKTKFFELFVIYIIKNCAAMDVSCEIDAAAFSLFVDDDA